MATRWSEILRIQTSNGVTDNVINRKKFRLVYIYIYLVLLKGYSETRVIVFDYEFGIFRFSATRRLFNFLTYERT